MKGKKTGGRTAGVPNSDNPLRGYLRISSEKYFKPNDANPDRMSDYEMDLNMMLPKERAECHLKEIEYHTSKLKSVEMDMNLHEVPENIADRLARLALEDTDNPPAN